MSRKPPRQPNWRNGNGTCRWCGQAIVARDGSPDTRRSWHPECVTEYRVANYQGDAAKAVWARDRGCCAACGSTPETRPGRWERSHMSVSIEGWGRNCTRAPYTIVIWRDDWEADHITPLWAVDRDAPDAFRFWTIDNLQTLCGPCHRGKTAHEAGERARLRAKQTSLPLNQGAAA